MMEARLAGRTVPIAMKWHPVLIIKMLVFRALDQ